jgi:hypothetical protein
MRLALCAPLVLVVIGGVGSFSGCIGYVGSTVQTGGTGSAGTGPSGTAGTTGSAGVGTSGVAGTTGSAGTVTTGTAGTTGSAGRGGTTGTAGTGTTGSAGRGGTTGTAGTGTTGTAGTGTTGTGGATSCTFGTPTATMSTKISTVFSVTWSTSLTNLTSAKIDFGLTTSYGLTAPVDLTAASYKTLLLGMKPSMPYHYRITATNASGSCQSSDYMVMTGPIPNGLLPTLTLTPKTRAAGVSDGFMVTGSYVRGGAGPAYIFDADGTYVWWYKPMNGDACGTRMSYDGKYMWINSANVPDATAYVHRVTMDGLEDTDFSTPFAHLSHQVTPLPDGSIAFYTTGANQCDDIKIFPANGTPTSTATTLVNAKTAHGGTGMCHLNNIEYSPSDDTLIFSDLDNSCLTKVNRTTGATVWVMDGLNGITSTFTGDLWKGGEHGFHVIAVDDLLIFNNNSTTYGGTGNGSIALELKLNTTAKTVTKLWSFQGTLQNDILGDVQRLPNGNTVVDFATKSTIYEVDSSGTVLQQYNNGGNFGYIEKRASLYGPSTK